jgi:hypothetical protein
MRPCYEMQIKAHYGLCLTTAEIMVNITKVTVAKFRANEFYKQKQNSGYKLRREHGLSVD